MGPRAVAGAVPPALANRLGIAIGRRTYHRASETCTHRRAGRHWPPQARPATPAVGQHGHEGQWRARDADRGAGRTGHDRHDGRRSWRWPGRRDQGRDAGRRRRLRGAVLAGSSTARRHRHPCAGRPAAEGRRRGPSLGSWRQLMQRIADKDRNRTAAGPDDRLADDRLRQPRARNGAPCGHAGRLAGCRLRELFAADPRCAGNAPSPPKAEYLDCAKQRVGTPMPCARCAAMADAVGLRERIMTCSAANINATESRPRCTSPYARHQGEGDRSRRRRRRQRCTALTRACRRSPSASRDGDWRARRTADHARSSTSASAAPISAPVMATRRCATTAAATWRSASCRTSTAPISPRPRDLDPRETLFIVCSRPSATLETLANAHAALVDAITYGGDASAVANHFVAVSSQRAKEVARFGIDVTCSVSGTGWAAASRWTAAVGLSSDAGDRPGGLPRPAVRLPRDGRAFRSAPFDRNLPVLRWGCSASGTRISSGSTASLRRAAVRAVPQTSAYLQRLAMEQRQRASRGGMRVDYATGPINAGASRG